MASSRLDSEVHQRLGPYEVAAATRFGPRIIGLRRDDSPEILVELAPDVAIANEQVGTYRFRGGHRLWVSPEVPEVSHVPDGHQCLVTTDTDRLSVIGSSDSAGFAKELELHWDGTRLMVDHILRWTGEEPTQAAPWAITQLPLGGTAILPTSRTGRGSPHQADASLLLWPYTRLDDPRISWRERAVLVRADAGPQNKLGFGPSPEALGYLKDGYLFTKRFEVASGAHYPERGALGQVYFGEHFCELESVGPLDTVEPGAEAHHREVWEVAECPGIERALAAARAWGLE